MARATLYNTASFQDPDAVPQQTVSLNGGTATYSGSLSGTIWTLTSTGGGVSAVTRTVSTQIAITTGLQSSPNNNISITAPLYVRGNLCMSNNATIASPLVEVGGTVTISNNASIGTSGSPIQQAKIAGGCRYGTSGAFTSPCATTWRCAGSRAARPRGIRVRTCLRSSRAAPFPRPRSTSASRTTTSSRERCTRSTTTARRATRRTGEPVIARQLLVSNSAANNMPLNQLLAGMPATYATVTTLQTVPGSYAG